VTALKITDPSSHQRECLTIKTANISISMEEKEKLVAGSRW
jgi:hypothetical protein